jgi:hypothetical protein
MLKYPRGGLGGPPIFVACQSISVVVIELQPVEAFCLTPVIACLFFMASVVYVGDASDFTILYLQFFIFIFK